jgi:hypothetical protein
MGRDDSFRPKNSGEPVPVQAAEKNVEMGRVIKHPLLRERKTSPLSYRSLNIHEKNNFQFLKSGQLEITPLVSAGKTVTMMASIPFHFSTPFSRAPPHTRKTHQMTSTKSNKRSKTPTKMVILSSAEENEYSFVSSYEYRADGW